MPSGLSLIGRERLEGTPAGCSPARNRPCPLRAADGPRNRIVRERHRIDGRRFEVVGGLR